jgi:hypothetical protein
MKRKILRETDRVIIPITVTVAMRRFARAQSVRFPGCPRPVEGSASHFFNHLADMYATKIGIKAEGISTH